MDAAFWEFLKTTQEMSWFHRTWKFQVWYGWLVFTTRGVFGAEKTKPSYCTWYVDKAWKKGLNTCIEWKHNRIKFYHHLSVLLQKKQTNQHFQVILLQFQDTSVQHAIPSFNVSDQFLSTGCIIDLYHRWINLYNLWVYTNYTHKFYNVIKMVSGVNHSMQNSYCAIMQK